MQQGVRCILTTLYRSAVSPARETHGSSIGWLAKGICIPCHSQLPPPGIPAKTREDEVEGHNNRQVLAVSRPVVAVALLCGL